MLEASREWNLDPISKIPLHVQMARRILTKINAGDWKPGDQMPSERDLMRLANVSRATVRQALDELAHDGVLERIHGRGTFVRRTKSEQSLRVVYSFYEQLSAEGIELHDRVLVCETVSASPELAERLRLDTGDPVIHLQRLRSVGDTPMMLNVAYLPAALCVGLLRENFDTSLYGILRDRYDLPVLRAVDRFEATLADKSVTEHLKISRAVPLMYVERMAYTTGDVVLHYGQNFIRGDMCCFRTELLTHTTLLALKATTPDLWNNHA
jgi:GntR family transcriptional regulator